MEPSIFTWLVAAVHLLALPLGMAAVWARALALSGPLDAAGLRRVFVADNLWGLAAALWLGTGIWRAFGGIEKGALYYMGNPVFHLKMGLFLLVLALEIWPMVTLIRWRIRTGRGLAVDTGRARLFARLSQVEAAVVVAIVLAATALARGFGV